MLVTKQHVQLPDGEKREILMPVCSRCHKIAPKCECGKPTKRPV